MSVWHIYVFILENILFAFREASQSMHTVTSPSLSYLENLRTKANILESWINFKRTGKEQQKKLRGRSPQVVHRLQIYTSSMNKSVILLEYLLCFCNLFFVVCFYSDSVTKDFQQFLKAFDGVSQTGNLY